MRKLLVFQHAASEPLGVLDTHGHVSPAPKLSERVFHEFIELFEWRPTRRFASR